MLFSKNRLDTFTKFLQSKSILELADLMGLGISGVKSTCPFHEDKKPSFYINAEENYFKCFSCNRGGGQVKLVEEWMLFQFDSRNKLEALEKFLKTFPDYCRELNFNTLKDYGGIDRKEKTLKDVVESMESIRKENLSVALDKTFNTRLSVDKGCRDINKILSYVVKIQNGV